MLGPPKPRRLDQPIAVSLEQLVPANNFYRNLEAKLDLSFVREWTRGLYAERGRPSIDPVVFFKLQLVMFFEAIRSERQLIETASLNLAHRWYLGYTLDEALPDHSSLTRIRRRLGIDLFQRFFEQIVELCQDARLVWGRQLYVDATKVEANADLDSLVPRFSKEEVITDEHLVTSLDWSTYHILTFPEVPTEIRVELINRPEDPVWGAGEISICPMGAAIGNAIFDATGVRVRTVPYTPERVLAALKGA